MTYKCLIEDYYLQEFPHEGFLICTSIMSFHNIVRSIVMLMIFSKITKVFFSLLMVLVEILMQLFCHIRAACLQDIIKLTLLVKTPG